MNGQAWAALIAGGFTVVVALIALYGQRQERRWKRQIGEINGRGNVVQMLEKILNGQTGQDARLASIERRQNHDGERLDGMEHQLQDIDGRLVQIERIIDDPS